MLSPRLVALNRDEFVSDGPIESTVELDSHRGDSGLAELDLGEEQQ